MSKRLILVMTALLAMCAMTWADDYTSDDLPDPATLHTGTGAGTSCATGGCFVFGNEVNGFTGHTIDIYQQSASASALHDPWLLIDRKSTRLNSSHRCISYAVFCLKKKKKKTNK